MLQQRTVLDQYEVTRSGVIQVRFAIEVYDDTSGVVRSQSYHRTTIAPGGDVDAVVAAVNEDITTRPTLMAPAVDTDRLQELRDVCAVVHTPAVVAAFQAALAAAPG